METTIPSKSFSAAYGEFRGDDDDALLHAVILTYEFDESQLLSLALGSRDLVRETRLRAAQRAEIARIRPVVIYDAAKTRAILSIPNFLELHPWKSAPFSCHHSKAYCLVSEHRVFLALGSFNLTKTGLFENREVMDVFIWSDEDLQDSHLLRQWVDFLRQAYRSRLRESEQTALDAAINAIEERLAQWSPPNFGDSALLHSGYEDMPGGGGLKRLRELWEGWHPGIEPDAIISVSPFFDTGEKCFAASLLKTFPMCRKFTLATAEATCSHIGTWHFGEARQDMDNSLFGIPDEIGDDERGCIVEEAKSQGFSVQNRIFKRKFHAKVLILRNGSLGVIYMGSANFTLKAWENANGNQELGLAWKETNAETFCRDILKNLNVDTSINRYVMLPTDRPDSPATDEDDDEYAELSADYPDMVRAMILEPDANGGARFRLLLGNDNVRCPHSLEDYDIKWGVLPLWFSGGLSNCLGEQDFRSGLSSRRAIAFTLRDSNHKKAYLIPFQYSGEIIRDRESLIWPSTVDWLMHYLHPERDNEVTDGIPVPDEEREEREDDDASQADSADIDREENQVIAMQRYLSLFADFERSILRNVGAIDKGHDAARTAHKRKGIHDSIQSFCSLLVSEWDRERAVSLDNFPKHAFRIGEALLSLRNLYASHPEYQDVFATLDGTLCEKLRNGLVNFHSHEKRPAVKDAGQYAAIGDYVEFVTTYLGTARRQCGEPEMSP